MSRRRTRYAKIRETSFPVNTLHPRRHHMIAYSTHQTDHGMIAYVDELHVSKHSRGSRLSIHLLCHILNLHPHITHLHFVTRHSAPQQASARYIFFTLLDCEKGVPPEYRILDHDINDAYIYCRISRTLVGAKPWIHPGSGATPGSLARISKKFPKPRMIM